MVNFSIPLNPDMLWLEAERHPALRLCRLDRWRDMRGMTADVDLQQMGMFPGQTPVQRR
jgi:hypothetical protein